MGTSLIHEAAIRLWSDDKFQSNFRNLKLANVQYNLSLEHQSQAEIDFLNLLRAASLFSLVQHKETECDKYHEAAFRIAYIAAKVWKDQPKNFERVVAIILSRIGNFPTIKKQLANDDLVSFIENQLKALPHSFALESMARYEGNTVKIGQDKEFLELTDFQRKLRDGLENENNLLSFASPTSSGKTYLLQQFLGNKAIKSIGEFRAIYVVPTRALITEIAYSLRRLLSDKHVENVEVLSVGGDLDQDIPNKVIYVFTQERLLSFLANITPQKLPFIDYIIIDEAHQIAEKARGTLLHQSLNWLKNSYKIGKFIFCSPVISNPHIFENLLAQPTSFSSESHMTRVSPVTQNLLVVEGVKGKRDSLTIALHDFAGEKIVLSEALKLAEKRADNSKAGFLAYCAYYLGKGKRNIVYVDDPSTADKVANKLMELMSQECEDPEIIDASNYISDNIHSDFVLAKSMRHRIGIHYGKMPSLVRETVERLFREEKLDFIICTSTLAQGVNLPAQNLFILDPKVRNTDTNTVDSISRTAFWNIVGRAGRLYKDFEGNVFLLKLPTNEDNWEDQFLKEDKLSSIILATQNVILEQRKELLEHITNPDKDAQKGIEEAASFVYDISHSKQDLTQELSWIPDLPQEALIELKLGTDQAEQQITIPHCVIKKNVGVSPVRQQALYDFLASQLILEDWVLPRSLSSKQEFHKIVSKILQFLDAPTMEPDRLKKYTWLYVMPAFDWVRGKPLNQMVGQHLNWWRTKENATDLKPAQVNSCIRDLFEQIESKVRFKLVKYLNCYNNILLEVCHQKGRGDLIESIPVHLPLFLEVGASNSVQIDLISLGLSRMTALELSKYIHAEDYDKNHAELKDMIKKITQSQKGIPKTCMEEIKHYIL